MKTPILEMKHIRKTFASTVALGDVDLNVYPGEIRGLIGENGSGKSTISSIAAGMQKVQQLAPRQLQQDSRSVYSVHGVLRG